VDELLDYPRTRKGTKRVVAGRLARQAGDAPPPGKDTTRWKEANDEEAA